MCVRPRSSPHSIGCDVVERLLARTPVEEIGLRSAFLKKYGAKHRLWLLETCSFSHGAQRQRARADILGEGLRSVPNGHNAFVPVGCAYPADHLGQALEEPTFNIPGPVSGFSHTHICAIVHHRYPCPTNKGRFCNPCAVVTLCGLDQRDCILLTQASLDYAIITFQHLSCSCGRG